MDLRLHQVEKSSSSFAVGSQVEGCVADDESSFVYMGQESHGVWKYGAEPGSGNSRVLVDDNSGHLNSDVEGVTIYYASGGKGYILVSSQGASEYDVYDRQSPHNYLTTFKVQGASSTDGIDVNNANLGSIFPQGMFIVHSGGAALRAVSWQAIANGESFLIDTTWNPRGSGEPFCGDGPCNGTETCASCPQDCGTCGNNQAPGIVDLRYIGRGSR